MSEFTDDAQRARELMDDFREAVASKDWSAAQHAAETLFGEFLVLAGEVKHWRKRNDEGR